MPAASESRGSSSVLGYLMVAVVAGAVFWIAYDGGSYTLASRTTLAIAVFWGIALGLVLRLLSPARLPGVAVVVGGWIAALAAWTSASIVWAPSAEDAFNEFDRVTLYLGVYVLVALAARPRTVGRWADAFGLGTVAVAAIAIVSRLFPGTFADPELESALPSLATRLAFPLGYWNALAIFLGLGVPLLLRAALLARGPVARGLAVAPLPMMAATIYLTSSRGGVATALVGTFVFVCLTERRWSAAGAVAAAGLGSAAAIMALLGRDDLVNGPLGSDQAVAEGRSAALVLALACALSALAYGVGVWLLGPRLHPGRTIGRVAVGATALVVVGGLLALDPVERFEAFKRVPPSLDQKDLVREHLVSSSGTGRWQVWSAAADQWREHELVGQGAGSFESWWAEQGTLSFFVRDAHSLYLESLGELGILGLLLTGGLVVIGAVVGARRSLYAVGDVRITTAALTASFVGYAFAAGFDWIWEMTAVSVVAFAALALITGPATAPIEPLRLAAPDERRWALRGRTLVGVLTGVTAWILLCAQAVPLFADREVARSRDAVARHDLREAMEAAKAARDIQPWAATPYLQLALVAERVGDVARARTWVNEAIRRDARDWRLWLVSARLETKLGNVGAAENSLRRAAGLNPRSPLFRDLLVGTPGGS